MYFRLFFRCIFFFSLYGKLLSSFVYVIIYCLGAGISTLKSIFDTSDPYFFCWTMEKTPAVKEEMDGRVFISRKSRHFSRYEIIWLKYFSLFVPWFGVWKIMFPPKVRYKKEKWKYCYYYINCSLWYWIFYKINWPLHLLKKTPCPSDWTGDHLCWTKQNFNSVFTADRIFFPSDIATLRNKGKLASVSRETPESTRNSRAQNTLDPSPRFLQRSKGG